MKRLNLVLFLFTMIGAPASVFAGEQPFLTSIVSGNTVITVDAKPESKNTNLLFTIYDSKLETSTTKTVVVNGIAAKICVPVAVYSPYSTNELLCINVGLREKMFSGGGLTVGIAPDFTIMYQYKSDPGPYAKVGPMDDAFFALDKVPCMPGDHLMGNIMMSAEGYAEQDASTGDGGMLYLRHGFMEQGEKKISWDNSVKTALYFYKPEDGSIKKMWKLSIEEQQIINYKATCFGKVGFLFTSSAVGAPSGKTIALIETRMRMFDMVSGALLWNVVLPVPTGHQCYYSNMTYDAATGATYVACNNILAVEKVNSATDGGLRTSFMIAKITKDGKMTNDTRELKWLEYEVDFQHSLLPLLLVKHMAVLKDGTLQVASLFSFWRENDAYANTIGEAGSTSFAFPGLDVRFFDANLSPGSIKQYASDPKPTKEHVFCPSIVSFMNVLRGNVPMVDQQTGTKVYWNATSEELIFVQAGLYHVPMLKSRDVFALKMVSGKETFYKSIGSTQMEQANYLQFGFYAIVTEGKYIHYTDNDRNPRKRATYVITQ